ncbi:MAG: phenylalanine--tRNA ligase subunit beta [Ignavibacteriales bacterium]
MKVSLDWLKDYVEINLPAAELAHKLTMAGIAVEGIEEIGDDTILELELTPNRGDCYGLINVAREVAALTGNSIHMPTTELEEIEERIEDYVQIAVEPDLCSRYAARAIKNVRVAPSPGWMQERLEKAGIRPINNVVDITNYVMLETNQPMHAFDYDLLQPSLIMARRARTGEKLTTLDGMERELDTEMLVIADATGPIALAGVMGGESSEIRDETTTILLEAANFSGTSIRKTARKMAMRTESSMRFEKGIDIEAVTYALDRAARLLEILGAGEVVQGIFDVYPFPRAESKVALRVPKLNRVLGTDLSIEMVKNYLESLQFQLETGDQEVVVTVPSYRIDIEIEEDLIEEVARLHGFDNISPILSRTEPTQGYRTDQQRFEEKLVTLTSQWMRQVVTYSFINQRWFDIMCIPEGNSLRNVLEVLNPFSEEQGVMRTTIIAGLLDVANRNIARRNESLAIFEMGNVFRPRPEGLPEEVLTLAGLTTGKTGSGWQALSRDMDFFFLKGLVEQVLAGLYINDVKFVPESGNPVLHPGRAAAIYCGDSNIGIIGEVHPQVIEAVGASQRMCVFEIDVQRLYKSMPDGRRIHEISRYPAVTRDLALVVDEEVNAGDLMAVIRYTGGQLLRGAELFDIYRSAQLGADKKSLAFALTFQSFEGTLQEEEISRLMQAIIESADSKLGAKLR